MPVVAVNCLDIEESDIKDILSTILQEFPVKGNFGGDSQMAGHTSQGSLAEIRNLWGHPGLRGGELPI